MESWMYDKDLPHIIPILWDGQISLVHLQDGYSCTIAKKIPPSIQQLRSGKTTSTDGQKICTGPRGNFTMFQHMLDDLQLFLVRIGMKWGTPPKLNWWSFSILEFEVRTKIIPKNPSQNRPVLVSRKKSQPCPTWWRYSLLISKGAKIPEDPGMHMSTWESQAAIRTFSLGGMVHIPWWWLGHGDYGCLWQFTTLVTYGHLVIVAASGWLALLGIGMDSIDDHHQPTNIGFV